MQLKDGVTLHLHETAPNDNDALSMHIRREQTYFEAHILDYIRSNHPNQKVILDIGANIGNHTVFFAKYLTYTAVVAFEPISANYALLLRNIAPFPNILAAHVAVGDHVGFVPMVENHKNMGNSRVSKEGPANIPLTTIDDFEFKHVTLMKIDVENYEPEVLRGAKETIAQNHPLILIEDWNKTYGPLLPGYEIEKAWKIDHTYLYRWING